MDNRDTAGAGGERQSIFNEAFALINRVNTLVQRHHDFISNKNYDGALTCLDLFYQEISPKLTDNEIKELDKLKEIAEKHTELITDEISKQGNGIRKKPIMIAKENIRNCKKSLDAYIKLLKRLQDKKGLGVPDKDGPGSAII